MSRLIERKRPLLIAGVAIAAVTAAVAVAVDAPRDGAPSAETEKRSTQPIMRAVFADERLWLLHDDGMLASLHPDEAKSERVVTGGRVREICKSEGSLFAVLDDRRNRWTVQQRVSDRWIARASVPAEGDTLAAIDCTRHDAGVTLVTNRRVLEIDDDKVRSVRLKPTIDTPLANGTALTTGNAVWVGFNVGEWGGGLRRITRTDGKVEVIEQNRSGDLCGGPLNTACDPVNGIVTAPWNSSCVVAAIGLVHMMSHGRIVEVCGHRVRRLYFKAFDPQPPNNPLDEGEPASTIAFFGLARSGNTLWAVGIDGLYRFNGMTPAQFRPLPKFENKGGYWVSFDVPGIALVLTDVNQRLSMSGSVPIMAVR
ncbi:MAG: hypothetical protein H0V46_06065 [Sphingomonas sp.]|nr:hypothetical protein [Sphingomonas sp.]